MYPPEIQEALANVQRTGHVIGYDGEHPLMRATWDDLRRIARFPAAARRLRDGCYMELNRRRNLLGDAAGTI